MATPNYKPVPTKDGYATVRPAPPQAFVSTRSAAPSSRPSAFRQRGLAHEERYALFRGRVHQPRRQTTDEWVELFDKLTRPAAYNTIDELMTDPHLKDVGFFKENHPTEGKLRVANPPIPSGARGAGSRAP